MQLLVCLTEHAGETVSIDDLLNQVWPDVTVSQDSVYQAVASLRRSLGDDPKQPTYIATVPRMGYRMVAKVSPWSEEAGSAGSSLSSTVTASAQTRWRWKSAFAWISAAALCIVIFGYLSRDKTAKNTASPSPALAAESQRSVAVLPFLDLTDGMKEEEFAGGMTEELIDKLSKIPGLRVPSATSSFYFKGKQIPVADIAKSMGVAYVVDGSVRKSGARLRVAARLVRAENGYVMWTENYDRPFDDHLMIQDDIAGEVAKALRASIDTGSR